MGSGIMPSVNEILETDSKQWSEMLGNLFVYELQDLLKIIEHDEILRKKDNIKELISEIQTQIKNKQEVQIKKFKKTLSPNLEKYLASQFSDIENIHEEQANLGTPMQNAIKLNRTDIIKELIELEGTFESYTKEKDYFSCFIFENLKIIQENIACINTIPRPKRDEVYSALLNTMMEHFDVFGKSDINKLSYLLNIIKAEPLVLTIFKDAEKLGSFDFNVHRLDRSVQKEKINPIKKEFLEFIVSKINPECFVNLTDDNIAELKDPLKVLIDLLRTDLEDHEKDSLEFQAYIFKLAMKIYNNAPNDLKKEVALSIKQAFYLHSNVEIMLLPLAEHIHQKTVKEAVEFLLEQDMISDQELDGLVLLCIKNKQSALLNFLIEFNKSKIEKLIVEILKFQVTTNDWEKRFLEDSHVIFALKYIEKLSAEEKKLFSSKWQYYSIRFNALEKRIAQIENKEKKLIEKPKYSLDIAINDSLFGHVHNDHALKGTNLEGNKLVNTLKYLNKYLSDTLQNRFEIPNIEELEKIKYLHNLQAIKGNIENAIEIAEMIHQNLNVDSKSKEELSSAQIVEDVTQHILQKLLQNQGNLLIPGGWAGMHGKSGHAMLYEFKVIDNKIFFLIHNTGSGIGNHMQEESHNEVLYSSIKAFELPFPAEKIKDNVANLQGFINLLIEPHIKPVLGEESYNADKLYQSLTQQAQKLGFVEKDPRLISKEWIVGQRSGTCSWKVLGSYLKTFPFESGVSYEDVRFEIKRFALEDYFKTMANRLSDPIVQNQFNFALQSFARLTNRLSEKHPPLSKERQENALKLIQMLEKALEKARLEHYPKDLDLKAIQSDLPQYQKSFIQPKKADQIIKPPNYLQNIKEVPTQNLLFEQKNAALPPPPITAQVTFSLKDPVKSINDFLEIIQKNYQNNHYPTVVKMIDDFYQTIPLPLPDLKSLSQDELIKFMTCLKKINSLYASSCANQDLKPFAENIATLNYGKALFLNVLQNYFQDEGVLKALIFTVGYSKHQKQILNSPYFIAMDPEINKRIKKSFDYAIEHEDKIEKNKQNFESPPHAILSKHPDCVTELLHLANQDEKFTKEGDANKKKLPDFEKAVMYYLNNFDMLKDNIKLEKLNDDISCYHLKQQIDKEYDLFIEGKLDALHSIKNALGMESNWITQNKAGAYHVYVNNSSKLNVYESNQIFKIDQTQPKIQDIEIQQRLTNEKNESNTIQMKNVEGVLSEKSSLLRTLANLRANSNTQISATIDFMKKEFGRLDQKDLQAYVFLNLFQGDLLEKQLQATPNLADELIQLVEKGLKIHLQNTKLKEPALFFLKTLYGLRHILSLQKRDLFNTIDKQVDELIENLLKTHKDNPYTQSQLRTLYTYQLVNMDFNLNKQNIDLTQVDASKIMNAIIFRQNFIDTHFEDPFLEFQARKRVAEYIPRLEIFFSKIRQDQVALHKILDPLLLHFKDVIPSNVVGLGQWQGEFPEFKWASQDGKQDISINVLNGQILFLKNQYVPLPSQITNHPLYTHFFNEKNVKAIISADQKSYEFTIQGEKYRFSLNNNGIIQKEMTINNEKRWYQFFQEEYQTVKETHVVESKAERLRRRAQEMQEDALKALIAFKTDEKTTKEIRDTLPLSLKQQGLETWVSLEPLKGEGQQWVVLNAVNHEKVATYYSESKSIYRLDEKGQQIHQQLIDHQAPGWLDAFSFMTGFESPQFLEFWAEKGKEKEEESQSLIIRLPRYGIEFKQNKLSDGKYEYIWNKDPRYTIDLDYPYQVVPGFNASIVLKPRSGENVPPIVLMPKQEFKATNREEGEYYLYQLDTENEIFKNRLVKAGKYHPSELASAQYIYVSNQEKYATYKLSGINHLSSESISDQLFLVYIYLGKRQPLRAFETLKQIMKLQYTLTAEHIEWLRKIIEELPAKIALNPMDEEIEENAFINSPEYIATRALAASILVHQQSLNTKIDFAPKYEDSLDKLITAKPNARLANKDYHALSLQKTKDFYTNTGKLNNVFASTYQKYLNTYHNIPEVMRLQRDEELHILRSIEKTPEIILPAHIRFRKKMLGLEKLNYEKQQLEMIMTDHKTHFTPKLAKRLTRVDTTLSKEHNISKRVTTLVQNKVDIQLDPIFLNLSSTQLSLLNGIAKGREVKKIAVKDWNITIKEPDFLFNFVDFFNIALKGDKTEIEMLKMIVDARLNYIAQQRYHDKHKILSLVDNLTIVLAYVIYFPDSFKPIDLKTSPDLAEILKQFGDMIKKLNNDKKIIQKEITVAEKVLAKPIELRVTKFKPKIERKKSVYDLKSLEPSKPITSKYRDALLIIQNSIQKKLNQQPIRPLFAKADSKTKKEKDMNITEILQTESEVDYEAGVTENRHLLAQNEAMKLYYQQNKANIEVNLKDELNHAKKSQTDELANLEKTILELANQLPSDPTSRMKVELEFAGGQREVIATLDKLFHLFLTQDPALYRKILPNGEQIRSQLNTLIFEYLIKATNLQHAERILDEINKLKDEKITAEMRETVLNKLGFLLNLQRCFDPTTEPELLLFEYLDNKILFPKQYDYLKDLLTSGESGYNSQSVQLIMGGGKSKVLLPLLALKKAKGSNLSIIEVPESLFNMNLSDLSDTTQKKFGKKAFPLIFNDTVECTEEYLKNLHYHLRRVMLNREYLLTTKESIQSLELNYLKLLRYAKTDDPIQNRKLKYFSNILNIIRDGDVIIDEVDSTLDVRKQLIYTVGKGDSIPSHEIAAVLDLFKFFKEIEIHDILNTKNKLTMQDIVDENIFPIANQWHAILERIAKAVIEHKNSPLQSAFRDANLNTKEKDELRLYLLNQSKSLPNFLDRFSPHDKDKIVLYKEEISNVIATSMQKLINENVGLPKDLEVVGFDKEIAIPYLANNIPNEGSRFGHYVETLNYTIKVQMNKSLSEFVVKSIVKKFIEQSEEILRKKSDPEAYQRMVDNFEKLTGTKLEDIDLADPKKFNEFYNSVKDLDKVKHFSLMYHILPEIEKNAITLQSDAHNHGSQFRSKQGLTGTNWNYRCQPIGMKANLKASLGSDGQTIDHLLSHPSSPILLPSLKQDIKNTIMHLFSAIPNDVVKKMHAWIDLGAYFKGVSNREVANKFAEYFSEQKDNTLRYILYLGADNRLYALPITKTASSVTPILLESTDREYIQKKLACSPEHCFTYYDQVHGTGTDIAQSVDAYAYVTLGTKTLTRDLLQAVMRMRELKGSQRIIFVLPKEVQNAHPEIKANEWTIENIIKICMLNQANRLADDHYRATIQKMQNVLRNDLLERILNTAPVSQQQTLIKLFEETFFTNFAKSAFEQFKDLTIQDNTAKILKEVKENILLKWQQQLKNANIGVSTEESRKFEKQLVDIVNDAIPICHETENKMNAKENRLGTEVSIEQEQETERQQELESEFDLRFRGGATPLEQKTWGFAKIATLELIPNTESNGVLIYALETMAKTHHIKRTWEFSPNILVTENYMNTCEIQPNKLDAYQKDALFFLMIQNDKTGTLKTLIITPEEAAHFKQKLLKEPLSKDQHIWVETTHHTMLAGSKPDANKLHPDYSTYIEQLSLFSGDTDILNKSLTHKSWFKTEGENKLKYLTEAVIPLHKDKTNFLLELNQKLAGLNAKTYDENAKGSIKQIDIEKSKVEEEAVKKPAKK